MAINPTPGPVLCFNTARHRPGRPPPAAALVRQPATQVLTGRCDPCLRSLAAVSEHAVLVDVYDLGAPRVGDRHDPDPA